MPDGFTVTIDDLRVTAGTFARVESQAGDAAAAASGALAGAAGMAGDDVVLARWRDAYDAMVAAVWAATGTVTATFGSIATRLTDSGNAYLQADHASTVGASGSAQRLPDPALAGGSSPPPPPSTGPMGIAVPEELAAYWPGGDPGLLRGAASAWSALAEGLDDAAFDGNNAFGSLLAANSGAGFSAMGSFWARHYEFCGSEPLFNAVPNAARVLARSCTGLADLIDSIRSLVANAAIESSAAYEGFELPASILAKFTRGATEVVLLAGKAALTGGFLEIYRDEYLRGLDRLVLDLTSGDRERLERLAAPEPARTAVEVGLHDVGDVTELGLSGSAWDGARSNNDTSPPTPDTVHLTPDRSTHILDGDGPKSGGHRSGTGKPGKSEFPSGWDDDRILGAVIGVARDPESIPFHQDNLRWKVWGVVDDVTVEVIVAPGGNIITAYPVSGPGVVRNPSS